MAHSVLIVEDDPCFRDTFAKVVTETDDLQLAGCASNLAEGQRLFDALQPQVLLVDLKLPDGSGIALIRHAHETLPQCQSMVITVFANDDWVLESIQAGATGYLLKDADDLDIARHIRQLCNGGSPISPAVARRLLRRVSEPLTASPEKREKTQRSPPGLRLSAQELTVLRLSSKGYNYEEIATLMLITRSTVETYVKRIYGKLQVHSKTEAVFEARQEGLLD